MDIPLTRRRWPRIAAVVLVVAVGLTASVVTLGSIEPAVPSVARETLWTAKVQRGEMVREVRARGKLLPVRIRWITAPSPARIERSHVRSGDAVAEDALLFELSNPSLGVAAARARADRAAATVLVETLRRESDQASIKGRSALSEKNVEQAVATANAEALETLRERGVVASLEHGEIQARRVALDEQVALSERHLATQARGYRARIAAQRRHALTLQDLVVLQRAQIEALKLRTPNAGVVQDVSVHEGQWVVPGDVLAKVADPTELKAVLEVPQSQARDVAVGQPVHIELSDTKLAGKVVRIAPSVQEGSVAVEVALRGELPSGARPELLVHGTIEIERIPNTLYVERPAQVAGAMRASVFRIDATGATATRVEIEFGRLSAKTIEILHGADLGDTLVVSDTSKFAQRERIVLR